MYRHKRFLHDTDKYFHLSLLIILTYNSVVFCCIFPINFALLVKVFTVCLFFAFVTFYVKSKVRELEEKCRSQSEQFGLLSQELEKFRLQASKVDLSSSSLLNNPSLSVLTNGVGLTAERGEPRELRRHVFTNKNSSC